jgi:hypothetical protein
VTDNEIALDHVIRGYEAARSGRAAEASAHLSMALWPRPGLKNVPEDQAIRVSDEWEEDDYGDGIIFLHPDIRLDVQFAYEDLISKRIPQAVEILVSVLWPDGIPPHVEVVGRRKEYSSKEVA